MGASSPEFSRPLDLAKLDHGVPVTVDLIPTAEEIAALTTRLGLISLDGFTAKLMTTRLDDGAVAVSGSLVAEVVQRCGVTLNPVPASVAEQVELIFLPPDQFEIWEETTELEEMLDGPDVEPLDGERLDLGEIAAQSLALGLDPFPRDPSAPLEIAPVGEPAGEGQDGASPFAKLAKLKGQG